MKLKIDVNLNRAPKKLNKNNKNKNKNQPHASHISHVTTKNMSHATMQKTRATQLCENTSHATMQTMQKRLQVT